jgi:hypothetical protein
VNILKENPKIATEIEKSIKKQLGLSNQDEKGGLLLHQW